MINFARAFDSAWERMQIILFRPFAFGKWCAIGLSAFLAGLMEGGNGVSFNGNGLGNFNNKDSTSTGSSNLDLHDIHSKLSHLMDGFQAGLIIGVVLAALVFIFALVLLVYWLGARGQFMFLDNIVRNRGALAEPWSRYSRQANSLFGFFLLVFAVTLVVVLGLVAVALVMCIPLFQHPRWPNAVEIVIFVILGLLYLGFCLAFGLVTFIFREFGVPLMFRNGLMAGAAFWESMSLIKRHTASVVVFVLLRFALHIGVSVVAIITCCCCVGLIPYVGTVVLLPALIYVRCFTLDCLAQFGPEYDVWTVDVPATNYGQAFTPPPPLG